MFGNNVKMVCSESCWELAWFDVQLSRNLTIQNYTEYSLDTEVHERPRGFGAAFLF